MATTLPRHFTSDYAELDYRYDDDTLLQKSKLPPPPKEDPNTLLFKELDTHLNTLEAISHRVRYICDSIKQQLNNKGDNNV